MQNPSPAALISSTAAANSRISCIKEHLTDGIRLFNGAEFSSLKCIPEPVRLISCIKVEGYDDEITIDTR